MDIESKWAKSTESRLEMFLDDYLIRSSTQKVRLNSQKLLLSLFKKGNREQQSRILSLILQRCSSLPVMGRASQNFLNLIQNIFESTSDYQTSKNEIMRQIFSNFQTIYSQLVSDPNCEFYAFASNLINFGNEQFKPYLLEANGCLKCYGRAEIKPQFLKLESVQSMQYVFTNKLQITFKRHYEIKDLTINLKTSGRYRSVSIFYKDRQGDLHKIGKDKYKPGEAIPHQNITSSGLLLVFQPNSNRRSIQCVFCGTRQGRDQTNYVCSSCIRRNDKLDISGTFKIVGADQQKITEQLCQDFTKLRSNVGALRDLHIKIQQKQKINLQLGLDQMLVTYDRIVNNLSLLHAKNPSPLMGRESRNCFSCNYYQTLSIINFLKDLSRSQKGLSSVPQKERGSFKESIRKCLKKSDFEYLKKGLLETLSGFIAFDRNYKKEILDGKDQAELIVQILKVLKSKKNSPSQNQIDDELQIIKQICTDAQFVQQLNISERIKIFVSYFLEWQLLAIVEGMNENSEVQRLNVDQLQDLKNLVNFDMSKIFGLNLNCYLKAFLKLLPESYLPKITLNLANSEFLQYIHNQTPEIDEKQIKDSIISCPNSMIKLDMFASLPVLIERLPGKQSVKLMNALFPYKNAWNLNIIRACKVFEQQLQKMPAEEQIYICLQGYSKCREYFYIERIHKLLVPKRLKFIIKLDHPQDEIDRLQIQYPFLSIRQVRSQQLQGDTIKALHDWVYDELAKNNHAMPLDIIVEKNIIDNMDLPIEVVYQNIAENKSKKTIGDKCYEYFRVIYRVQGILGQPKQRSIGNPRDQKLETCIAHSSHFLNRFQEEDKRIGLDILIKILEGLQPGSESQSKKVLLFEILSTLSMNEGICKRIIEGQYGDSIINATVKLMSFENEKDAKITNFLLQLSSKVIDEANQEMINLRKGSRNDVRKYSGMDVENEGGFSQSERKVKFVLERFSECEKNFQKTGNQLYKDIAKRLIKLLPFCSKDQIQPSTMLFNFFQFTNWSSKYSLKLQYLTIFMESLSQSYMTFKGISKTNGVTDDIIKAILNGIRKNNQETVIDEKKFPQSKTTVESALLILCSLIQGDQELQRKLFQSNLFHNIYEISQIPPKKSQQINAGRIPQNCYKIIKYFSEGKIVEPSIHEYLAMKKKEEKAKLAPKKNKKWEQMKNKQKNALAGKVNEGELQGEKDMIVCSSCQEGYTKRKDILGLYIYQTKHQIPSLNNWWKDSRRMASFTSSTFFTAIHFDCHMRAFEADQKIQRSEWDGALIRNMDVLCNSLIPVKGPKTTNDEISRFDKKYFERNKNGNYWNVLNDLNGLLEKLSKEFDFATESKGSSSLHNIRYIPILMGFAIHFLERNKNDKSPEDGVKYLMEHPPKKASIINLFLCCVLFYFSYEKFQEHKKTFLKWILDTKKQDCGVEKWFSESKCHLMYLKIVEQLFEIIHKKVGEKQQESVYRNLDFVISNNLQTIIPELDALNDRYKSQYTKCTTIEDFNI